MLYAIEHGIAVDEKLFGSLCTVTYTIEIHQERPEVLRVVFCVFSHELDEKWMGIVRLIHAQDNVGKHYFCAHIVKAMEFVLGIGASSDTKSFAALIHIGFY